MSNAKEVFYVYENVEWSVKFIANGYLLSYKDHGLYAFKTRAFHKFEDLTVFLKDYYDGEWK